MGLVETQEVERFRANLVSFAIAVQREVNIRCRAIHPDSPQERKWHAEGVCAVRDLWTVKAWA